MAVDVSSDVALSAMTAKIDPLLAKSEHAVDICVVFALLWIAAGDGVLKSEKQSFIQQKLPAAGDAISTKQLLEIITSNDTDSFIKVFSVLAKQLSEPEKHFLLELAIGVAAADGELSTTENHILRFFADLLGFDALRLKVLFKIISGRELVEPGDPSSLRWWRQQITGTDGAGRSGTVAESPLSREDACHLLGVPENASPEEIKKAYKRRMQNYHPDRYESLGSEAKKIAQQTFIRIREAYEVLMR